MQRLLANALRYAAPENGMTDPVSGYPFEGWNHEPGRGLYLRSFTQLTAIGQWLELMANIAAGYADNPYVSRADARARLEQVADSLLHDQQDPRLGARGLLANFIGFDGSNRLPPLSELIEKQEFVDAFGAETAEHIWNALAQKGWIIPRRNGREAEIKRREGYGAGSFDGPLAQFAVEPVRTRIMELLDRRVTQIIFGDNANLSASVARAIGALLRPEIRDAPDVVALRAKLELFLENQRSGYQHLFDTRTGTFAFGWDATHNRWFGWEDSLGNHIVGHMDYLVNEFRGPLMFVMLRYGFPGSALANVGFKIKPYRLESGREVYTLATWEGSAFQSFGLTLFMGELENPAWRRILEDTLEIHLDFAARNRLPGFLSEAYSGRGVEYTGTIGIPDLAVTTAPRITNAPSLYSLGAAYQVAPGKVERFLEANWPVLSRMFTRHGPWEGWHAGRRAVIKYQTTAHTLALLLGGIGSGPQNMRRYLEFKGLHKQLAELYPAGDAVDFLSPETQIVPWTPDGGHIGFCRDEHSFRVEVKPPQIGSVTLALPRTGGVSLSGGELIICYRTPWPAAHVTITFERGESGAGPYASPAFANEVFLRFAATENGQIRIPLPATPGLTGTKGIVITFGHGNDALPVDLTITELRFVPY